MSIKFGIIKMLQKSLFNDDNILNLYQGNIKSFSEKVIGTLQGVAKVLSTTLLAVLNQMNDIIAAIEYSLDKLEHLQNSMNEVTGVSGSEDILEYVERAEAYIKKKRYNREEVKELLEESIYFLSEDS